MPVSLGWKVAFAVLLVHNSDGFFHSSKEAPKAFTGQVMYVPVDSILQAVPLTPVPHAGSKDDRKAELLAKVTTSLQDVREKERKLRTKILESIANKLRVIHEKEAKIAVELMERWQGVQEKSAQVGNAMTEHLQAMKQKENGIAEKMAMKLQKIKSKILSHHGQLAFVPQDFMQKSVKSTNVTAFSEAPAGFVPVMVYGLPKVKLTPKNFTVTQVNQASSVDL